METLQLGEAFKLLVRANHILHKHNVLDALGHISIRSPHQNEYYIMAAYGSGPPAIDSSNMHFVMYEIEDSHPVCVLQSIRPGTHPVVAHAVQDYSERFIHGATYKAIPDAECVVQSHSEDVIVIPFTVMSPQAGVKPVSHMAGFMGSRALPVFNAMNVAHYQRGKSDNHFVNTEALGDLARRFLTPHKVPVVLQSHHGFMCWGDSTQQALYRAIYTQKELRNASQSHELSTW